MQLNWFNGLTNLFGADGKQSIQVQLQVRF